MEEDCVAGAVVVVYVAVFAVGAGLAVLFAVALSQCFPRPAVANPDADPRDVAGFRDSGLSPGRSFDLAMPRDHFKAFVTKTSTIFANAGRHKYLC